MKPSVFLSAAVCATLALPAVASAQDQIWLRDRRYTEGAGYRVGDFEIHPGAAAEFGYDSNYLRRAPDESPYASLRLRLTPSVSLSTLGLARREEGSPRPSVEFKAGVSATYNEFFPVGVPAAGGETIRQQRDVGVNVDLGLVILPGRSWSGALNLSYMRAVNPTDQGLVSGSALTFNRDLPRGAAELIWTPGAGLFEWRLGYSFSGTIFEANEFKQLTNINNAATTRGRWRFLPRTSLMYDASFGFITYTAPGSEAAGGKVSSHPMRARLGVNGLITPTLSVLALGGWGSSFYSSSTAHAEYAENFDSFIGQLELKWFLTPSSSVSSGTNPTQTAPTMSSISVGFLRDFYDSYIGNYYERDRGYLSFSYLFGGRFLIVVDGGAGPVIYPKAWFAGKANPSFTDVRIDASLFAEYRFKDQFGVNASVRYNQNVSSMSIVDQASGRNDSLRYMDVETYLGLRWLM
jgi:hypothetical protein